LDKDTSGCLVVAKTEQALLFLQSAFKDRRVEKTYWALVHGHPQPQGRIETFFGRHPVHRKRFTGKIKQGKRAITEFQVMELLQGAALLQVSLLTGRTHQIRVHLSEAGHPLLADEVYGRPRKRPPEVAVAEERLGRHALHAWKIVFPHPQRKKTVSIEAPIPEDLKQALTELRAAS
jgi:23S rRNA pseudouridine1911/1915/1917 synthase